MDNIALVYMSSPFIEHFICYGIDTWRWSKQALCKRVYNMLQWAVISLLILPFYVNCCWIYPLWYSFIFSKSSVISSFLYHGGSFPLRLLSPVHAHTHNAYRIAIELFSCILAQPCNITTLLFPKDQTIDWL